MRPGAEEIVPGIQHPNHWAGQNQVLVISSTDARLHSDPEFRSIRRIAWLAAEMDTTSENVRTVR
jgi:hypothetical protein